MHDPVAAHLTFGVEIETTMPPSSRPQIGAYHHGIPVTTAPDFHGCHWKAEADSSIHPGSGFLPVEFVSPVLVGDAGVRHLEAFLAWAHERGSTPNYSCGIHVHVGLASLDLESVLQGDFIRRLVHLVHQHSAAIYGQTQAERSSNVYCAPVGESERLWLTHAAKAQDVEAIAYHLDCYRLDRYRILNLNNLSRSRRTLEFRAFASTVDADLVLCHLATVLGLCSLARDLTTSGKSAKWNPPRLAEAEPRRAALRNLSRRLGWSPKARQTYGLFGALAEALPRFRRAGLAVAAPPVPVEC